ncbi:hypothetical protein ACFYXP_40210 [Streptomyces sp. NPDC002466]|uniref:hypothetical protein n=1 Tax=unclassified Streptomyces TaxID=2593676 RepID=UPI0011E63E03|nr:hypothetical protein [Streptomyces sp. sk2.1]
MTSTPQPSDVGLARQALLAAREAVQRTGHARKTKPGWRTGTPCGATAASCSDSAAPSAG